MITQTNAELSEVSELVAELAGLDSLIESLKATMNEAIHRKFVLERDKLPEALEALGIDSLTLSDGTELDVSMAYGARINIDDRDEAHAWLMGHGFEGLIRTYTDTKVHPQTLRAWLREQVAAGNELPPSELFHLDIGPKAVVKRRK